MSCESHEIVRGQKGGGGGSITIFSQEKIS